jgi:hypothetical protein
MNQLLSTGPRAGHQHLEEVNSMRKAHLHYIKYAVTTLSTVGFAALAVKNS